MKGIKTMKRDVQVGVILGVIILAIIGVFLSTRTTVKEPNIPIPEIEEDTQVGILDIHDLPQDSFDESQETFHEVTTVQNSEQKKPATVNTVKVEEYQMKDQDNIIVGEWNKAKEEDNNTTTNDQASYATATKEDWMDVSLEGKEKITKKSQVYKVQQKDDLSKIARKYYGDASKWIIIFDANRSKIHDRNNLKIGTELIIPEEKIVSQKSKGEIITPSLSQIIEVEDTKSAVKTHRVQQGDSLYKLAVKYYDNGAKWNKILDANKKTLKNKKSLKVGQELIIPEL